MRRATLALLLALALPAAADEPRARKIEEDPIPPEVFGEPGRPLPSTVAICHDAAARRCWSAAREAECAPRGRIYRVIIDEPDEVAGALAACRKEPAR
jgi:hypothetical protein